MVIWATLRLADMMEYRPVDESTWTFGQIIPVVLLAAPILATGEIFVVSGTQTPPPSNSTPSS